MTAGDPAPIHVAAATGFALADDRGRPGCPDAALDWLAEQLPGPRVVDLAAGTGQLTFWPRRAGVRRRGGRAGLRDARDKLLGALRRVTLRYRTEVELLRRRDQAPVSRPWRGEPLET
jgi:hypothetical protein